MNRAMGNWRASAYVSVVVVSFLVCVVAGALGAVSYFRLVGAGFSHHAHFAREEPKWAWRVRSIDVFAGCGGVSIGYFSCLVLRNSPVDMNIILPEGVDFTWYPNPEYPYRKSKSDIDWHGMGTELKCSFDEDSVDLATTVPLIAVVAVSGVLPFGWCVTRWRRGKQRGFPMAE